MAILSLYLKGAVEPQSLTKTKSIDSPKQYQNDILPTTLFGPCFHRTFHVLLHQSKPDF
jgi:hypothetical protein